MGWRSSLRKQNAMQHSGYVAREEISEGQSTAYLGTVTAGMKGTF